VILELFTQTSFLSDPAG